MAARTPDGPPPKTSEPLAPHADCDAREMAAASALMAMSNSTGTTEDNIWDGAVAPAPIPLDGLNCSAARDNGLPAVDPVAAPRIAVDPYDAAVDHATSKLYVLEFDAVLYL